MENPFAYTVLVGGGTVRILDSVDLALIEAMLMSAWGPDLPMYVDRLGDGRAVVTLHPSARRQLREMATDGSPLEVVMWLDLLLPHLVESVVDRVGEMWRSEVAGGVEWELAERCGDVVLLADAAENGPLFFDIGRDEADILAEKTPNAGLAGISV